MKTTVFILLSASEVLEGKLKEMLEYLILERTKSSEKSMQDEMEVIEGNYGDIETKYEASLAENKRLNLKLEELRKVYLIDKQCLE